MTRTINYRELLEARQGLPTEPQAARKIATFAVIPAAMVGLFAGSQLVGPADPFGRLLWVCTATTFAAGFATAYLVLGVYYLFGFRPVVVLADALMGAYGGFLCGASLHLLLRVLNPAPGAPVFWPLLLTPLGAVAVPLIWAWYGTARGGKAVSQALAAPTAVPHHAPPEANKNTPAVDA